MLLLGLGEIEDGILEILTCFPVSSKDWLIFN